MKPFEQSLRLLLDLHVLMRDGKSDSEEADGVRDQMDAPARELSPSETVLISKISEALY